MKINFVGFLVTTILIVLFTFLTLVMQKDLREREVFYENCVPTNFYSRGSSAHEGIYRIYECPEEIFSEEFADEDES